MSEVSVPTAVIINTIGMMNSGAFIMIKISTVLGAGNFAGIMVMIAGGVVFLAAALIAVSQRNASKVLVWSTVSVMGLVAACAGIDSAEAVWAAVMLVMFHSVGKALLIMCVGSAAAHGAGYDIEEMTGVLAKMPKLSALMLLAMASMFVAPFGMLIAQWSALTASVDSGNLVLVAAMSFGSAVTAFYWIKWMAKLMSAGKNDAKGWGELEKNERLPQMVLAVVMIMMCLTFPLISMYLLVPYVGTVYGGISSAVLTAENMIILVAMLAVLVMVFGMFFGKGMKKNVPAYLGGGADAAHTGISLKTLYFEKHLSEKRITYIAGIVTAVVIVTGVGFMIGTLVNLLGGIA
jgi:ech hydrogenase subunit A